MFTNLQIEPRLFNKPQINEIPNQELYRVNFLQSILDQQHQINDQLSNGYHDINSQISNSFTDIDKMLEQSSTSQNVQFDNLLGKLENLEAVISQYTDAQGREETANQVIHNRLDQLENKNHLIIESNGRESLINQAILDQVSFQHQSIEELSGKLNHFKVLSEDLSVQLKQQEIAFDKISKQIEVQEVFHTTVMERIDQQEAITQKITRQLENLKSIVFERTAYLTEKIEANMKQLFKPVQTFFIRQEEKENKKVK